LDKFSMFKNNHIQRINGQIQHAQNGHGVEMEGDFPIDWNKPELTPALSCRIWLLE
jgi:hypothetical protein